MNSLLNTALNIALEAHKNQLDKAGHPYIEHILRVVVAVKTIEEKIVTAFYDVYENSNRAILEDLA